MKSPKFDEQDRSKVISEIEEYFNTRLSRVGSRRKYLKDENGKSYWVFGGYEDWHGIHNGGSATASTTTTTVDLNDDAVAGEFQVLRLEVTKDGTARWYIDGVLLQTVVGAVSTTTDFAVCLASAANASEVAIVHVDYLLVECGRDWTI